MAFLHVISTSQQFKIGCRINLHESNPIESINPITLHPSPVSPLHPIAYIYAYDGDGGSRKTALQPTVRCENYLGATVRTSLPEMSVRVWILWMVFVNRHESVYILYSTSSSRHIVLRRPFMNHHIRGQSAET